MDHILNITSWPQSSISQALHLFLEFTAGYLSVPIIISSTFRTAHSEILGHVATH